VGQRFQEIIKDAEAYPALGPTSRKSEQLANVLAFELDAVCGPVTDGNGKQLSADHLMVVLCGMELALRRMRPSEREELRQAYEDADWDDD